MKATVNGIQVEGTAKEIHQYVKMASGPSNIRVNLKLGRNEYSKFVEGIETELESLQA